MTELSLKKGKKQLEEMNPKSRKMWYRQLAKCGKNCFKKWEIGDIYTFFEELGRMERKHIKLSEKVSAVIGSWRKLKKELENMEKKELIKKVDEPT